MEQKLLMALTAHYSAELHKAEADLLIYFKNPIGVGEHGKLTEEMIAIVDRVSAARGGLEVVKSLAGPEAPQEAPQEN